MRIVLFGCQKITIDILEFLISTGQAPVAVITHDEERDKLFAELSVADYCFLKGIPTLRFDKKVDANMIAACNPDIIISTYYRKILSKDIIDLPKLGCINIHPGLLPRDRGPNPTYWNVLRGDEYAGTTLHYIDEGMDTGDILAQASMKVDDRTGFELNRDIMDLGVKLFKDNFHHIVSGTTCGRVQNNSEATCNIMFRNNFRYIDWCQPAEAIVQHIRAHAPPYGGSIGWWNNKFNDTPTEIIVNKVLVVEEERNVKGPGSFELMNSPTSNILKVQTSTRPVVIEIDRHLGRETGRFVSGVPE